jgi:hypothetical protein
LSLGLIVVGDYALATGADRHVLFVASLLGRTAHALEWVWLIPGSRVQLAAALHEAWQRPHPVACFGGLGEGVDDHTIATVAALQRGRDEVGVPRFVAHADAAVMQVGNVAFFHGDPPRAHNEFAQWWHALLATRSEDEGVLASEQVRWSLPETAASAQARQSTKAKHPALSQRVIAAADGEVSLRLTGASKGKVQAARKALQVAIKHL